MPIGIAQKRPEAIASAACAPGGGHAEGLAAFYDARAKKNLV